MGFFVPKILLNFIHFSVTLLLSNQRVYTIESFVNFGVGHFWRFYLILRFTINPLLIGVCGFMVNLKIRQNHSKMAYTKVYKKTL